MSPAVRAYLACYNFLSALAWLAVLRAMFLHFSAAAAAARGATALSRLWASLPGAARSLYGSVGGLLALVQTAALLEVAHAALGLVRSPLATSSPVVSVSMIASRPQGSPLSFSAKTWFSSSRTRVSTR